MPRLDVTIAGELNLDLILLGLPDEPPSREWHVFENKSPETNPSSPRNRQSLAVNLDEVRVYRLLIELEQAQQFEGLFSKLRAVRHVMLL